MSDLSPTPADQSRCPACGNPREACCCSKRKACDLIPSGDAGIGLSDLLSYDADVRRSAIMRVSRGRLYEFSQLLVNRLAVEPSVENQRHIIRALGNLRCVASCPDILALASVCIANDEMDLRGGDAAAVLGMLGYEPARSFLEQLLDSPLEWNRQNARRALRLLDAPEGSPR